MLDIQEQGPKAILGPFLEAVPRFSLHNTQSHLGSPVWASRTSDGTEAPKQNVSATLDSHHGHRDLITRPIKAEKLKIPSFVRHL